MYSVKKLVKLISVLFTAVIFVTAVSLFAKPHLAGNAYASDPVSSVSVVPVQSVLDSSDIRTVYRFDENTGKYVSRSYYDVYDYDNIMLTVNYGSYSKTYTGNEITSLTAALGTPLIISDGQSNTAWTNGKHTVTYTLGGKSAKATFTVTSSKIKSLSVTPMYTVDAIYNVSGSYRVFADEGTISQRFVYDLGGYDYNISITYADGNSVNCTAADLKQKTGYEPEFSHDNKTLAVGTQNGYCTVGGVTAKFTFNVISNPVKSVSLYMTDNADTLNPGTDGYYTERNDGTRYFRFIYDRTKIRAKVTYTSGSTADYPIGELCAKLHGSLDITDTQSISPWQVGTVTLPATINGIKTSLKLNISGAAAVTDLKAESNNVQPIKLTWSGGACTGYIVEKYNGSGYDKVADIPQTASSYTVYGLTDNTRYILAVRSYFDNGTVTLYSDRVCVSVNTGLSSPGGVSCTSRTSSTVTLSWNRNSSAAGYIIERKVNGNWSETAKLTSNETVSYKLSGLTPGVTNNLRIKSYNGSLNSQYTYIDIDTLPSDVTGFRRTDRTSGTVTLSWNKNTSATGYYIERYNNGKWTQIAKITNNSTISYKATGLPASTTCKFRIRAYKNNNNATGYSGYATVAVNTLPVNVGNFRCTGRTKNTVTLSWNLNSSAGGYIIQQYKSGKWVQLAKLTNGSVTSYKVSGLTPATSYSFRIQAYKTIGVNTVYSGYTSHSTLSSPTNVSGFACTARRYNSITLGWNRNSSATGYKIEQYKGGKWVQIAQIKSNQTVSCTVSGLNSSTSYSFRIRAYKTSGSTTAHSGYTTYNTLTSPTNVTSLKASKRTSSTVTLGWSKNSTATGYKIEQYKGGKWVQIAQITSNNTTSYAVSKLSRNTSYSFRIRAYKTINGKTSHSAYTTVKTSTTK